MPGKKLWTWGAGPSGRIWEDILTEGGGPYFEPQAGAFSDNQPDFHWMGRTRCGGRTTSGTRCATRAASKGDRGLRGQRRPEGGKAFAGVYATACPRRRAGHARGHARRTPARRADGARRTRPSVHGRGRRRRPASPSTTSGSRVYDGGGQVAVELVPARGRGPRSARAAGEAAGTAGRADRRTSSTPQASGSTASAAGRRRSRTTTRRCGATRTTRARTASSAASRSTRRAGRTRSRIFDRVLARDADNGRAHFGRGVALAALGRDGRGRARRSRRRASRDHVAAAERALARIALAARRLRARARPPRRRRSRPTRRSPTSPRCAPRPYRLLGEHEAALARGASARSSSTRCTSWAAARRRWRSRRCGRPADDGRHVWRGYMRDSVQNQLELASAYIESACSGTPRRCWPTPPTRAPRRPRAARPSRPSGRAR